jgi:hypothetical protein
LPKTRNQSQVVGQDRAVSRGHLAERRPVGRSERDCRGHFH